MQKTILIITCLLLSLIVSAQQFSLDYGKVISKFDYKNSAGEKLENIQSNTDNHLALGFYLPVSKVDLYLLSGIALNKYGAQYSDEILENYYNWEVNYFAITIGAGYEFLKSNSMLNLKNTNSESGVTFFIQFVSGMEFLMQGTQTINNQVYNLKGAEQFNKPLLIAQGGLGVKYYASKSIAVFVQYTGGKSFSVFKSDSDDTEKLNIITHTISLGINISLPFRK